MITIYDVLRRPLMSEKSSHQYKKLHQYAFEVSGEATKSMIKDAVETLFDVTVERVNVMNVAAKRTRRARSRRVAIRRSGFKKAIVTLASGDTIDAFEGVR